MAFLDNYDPSQYVEEYVTHKLFDVAIVSLKKAVQRLNKYQGIVKIQKLNRDDSIDYIAQHLSENIKWASNISFRDMRSAKKLLDVFVELNL